MEIRPDAGSRSGFRCCWGNPATGKRRTEEKNGAVTESCGRNGPAGICWMQDGVSRVGFPARAEDTAGRPWHRRSPAFRGISCLTENVFCMPQQISRREDRVRTRPFFYGDESPARPVGIHGKVGKIGNRCSVFFHRISRFSTGLQTAADAGIPPEAALSAFLFYVKIIRNHIAQEKRKNRTFSSPDVL